MDADDELHRFAEDISNEGSEDESAPVSNAGVCILEAVPLSYEHGFAGIQRDTARAALEKNHALQELLRAQIAAVDLALLHTRKNIEQYNGDDEPNEGGKERHIRCGITYFATDRGQRPPDMRDPSSFDTRAEIRKVQYIFYPFSLGACFTLSRWAIHGHLVHSTGGRTPALAQGGAAAAAARGGGGARARAL